MQVSVRKKVFWCLLFLGLFLLPAITPAQAQSTLQGEVALQLARFLGLGNSDQTQAINALTNLGIIPLGGWIPGMQTSQRFITSLYRSLTRVMGAGVVKPPTGLPDSSSLMAAVLTSSGLSSREAVRKVETAGGERNPAHLGAGRGKAFGGNPTLSLDDRDRGRAVEGVGTGTLQECPGHLTRPTGSGGGGSGCVGSQSR
jgi:hypothetical protein